MAVHGRRICTRAGAWKELQTHLSNHPHQCRPPLNAIWNSIVLLVDSDILFAPKKNFSISPTLKFCLSSTISPPSLPFCKHQIYFTALSKIGIVKCLWFCICCHSDNYKSTHRKRPASSAYISWHNIETRSRLLLKSGYVEVSDDFKETWEVSSFLVWPVPHSEFQCSLLASSCIVAYTTE